MSAIEVRALAASEVGRLEQEEPPGYRGTGAITTATYSYVDDAGVTRHATETDETLVRDLG